MAGMITDLCRSIIDIKDHKQGHRSKPVKRADGRDFFGDDR
jgi:hypothetical protein